jgi:hypothetical protein
VCDCGSGIPRSETAEIPSSGGRRGCEKCYNRKYAAYADSDGGGEYSDDPSSGSGWHYSRNPPQRYTVTEGGRRVRLAGGNVFPSKGEAQRAVQFLRATEGGDYRVRAIKPGESVGRVAAVNGKKSTRSRKKRGATSVRRSMSNGRTKAQTAQIKIARELGAAAFLADKPRAPVLSRELNAMLPSDRLASHKNHLFAMALMKAYLAGWDSENLKAPVL